MTWAVWASQEVQVSRWSDAAEWLDQEAINDRNRKLDRKYQMTKNIYNKKTMSIAGKFRH